MIVTNRTPKKGDYSPSSRNLIGIEMTIIFNYAENIARLLLRIKFRCEFVAATLVLTRNDIFFILEKFRTYLS